MALMNFGTIMENLSESIKAGKGHKSSLPCPGYGGRGGQRSPISIQRSHDDFIFGFRYLCPLTAYETKCTTENTKPLLLISENLASSYKGLILKVADQN